jgi:RNA polymerase sigma factor (TIGR02999 family)
MAVVTGSGRDDADRLLALVYDELRAVAARQLEDERIGHTLQPTALVHEAYLRLRSLDRIEWRDRTHFVAAASGTIRRVLIEHARRRGAEKRGGSRRRLTLTVAEGLASRPEIDLLVLDDLLGQLARLDARKARVVEMRYFGGLTIDETARALGVGTTTVEDDWTFARAWLRERLDRAERQA